MPAIVALAAHVSGPSHNVGDPGRDILITPWAHVVLLRPRGADMAHHVWFTMGPTRALDRLRTKESGAVFRQGANLYRFAPISPWH